MRNIGVSGKAGSGKDTVADIWLEIDKRYNKVAFADKLKQACAALTGIPLREWYNREFKETYQEALGRTGREYMTDLGDAMRRIGIVDVMNEATIKANRKDTVIADVRTFDEVMLIRSRGGITIRVRRPGLDSGNHITETELDNFDGFEYWIDNDGTIDDLKYKVLGVYKQVHGIRSETKRYTRGPILLF